MSYVGLSSGPPSGPPESQPAPTSQQLGDFQAALGATVGAWQQIEMILLFAFQTAIKSTNHRVTAAAFFEVVNFRARLAMVDAVMSAQFGEASPTVVTWKRISERLARRSKRRNALTHGVIYFDHRVSAPERQLFIGPMVTNPAMQFDIEEVRKAAIYRKELLELMSSFDAVRFDLLKFLSEMPDSLFSPSAPA